MLNTNRISIPGNALTLVRLAALLGVTWLGCAPSLNLSALPQATLQAVTDRITYNAGDPIRIRIISPEQTERGQARYVFTVRYLGNEKPVAQGLSLGSADTAFPGYHLLWKTPQDARAGR